MNIHPPSADGSASGSSVSIFGHTFLDERRLWAEPCFLTEALVNLLILDYEFFDLDLAVAGKLDSENKSSVIDLLASKSPSPKVRF